MYIIAEIAQAHDGSLGNALKFIEEAKNCGADAVKFQAHLASAESTSRDSFRVNIFPQDSSRFNYWKRMEFSGQDWILIDQTCKKHGIDLIVSPFSVESLRLLEGLNVKYLKIGSGEITNLELISACLKTNLPIIISSGMSSWDELRICSDYCKKFTSNFSFLQCTSKYPSNLTEIGLNNIPLLKSRLGAKLVGLSDHSGDEDVGIAACAQGAEILEVHLCWHKSMFGPDTSSSLDPSQLTRLCNFRDKMKLLQIATDKDILANNLKAMKTLFERSLVASQDLKSGTLINETHIAYKKPAGGLTLNSKEKLIGKRIKEAMNKDDLFSIKNLL